jgi:hypothetical protein
MNTSRKIRAAILKKLDPQALQHPMLVSLAEHEARIASDPAIQQRKARIAKEVRRELMPGFVAAMILGLLLWGVIAWYLQGFFSPTDLVAAIIVWFTGSSLMFWRTTENLAPNGTRS